MRRAGFALVVVGALGFAGALVTACGSPAPRSTPATGPPPGTPPPASSTTGLPVTTAMPVTAPTFPTTPAPPAPTTSSATATTVAAAPALVVTRGHPSARVVALTFDAGSDAGYTARILDILKANNVHASFGITGLWADANPDLLRRIAAEGHQIVNHTWDHRSFTGASTGTAPLTSAQRLLEVQRAEQLIQRLTGRPASPWFRPPYGDRDGGVDADVGAAGYRYELMWTVDSLGWKGVPPQTVVERTLAGAAPGEIVLMHVGSASTDAAALPAVIASLRDRGYGFTTAAELLRS